MTLKNLKWRLHFMATIPTAHENAFSAASQMLVCLLVVWAIIFSAPVSMTPVWIMAILLGYAMLQGFRCALCMAVAPLEAIKQRDIMRRGARYLIIMQHELDGLTFAVE